MKKLFFGNTIKSKCIFRDFKGDPIDPYNVKFKVYKYKNYELLETFNTATRESEGVYWIIYTLPSYNDYDEYDDAHLVLEWYAEVDGSPTLIRERVKLYFDRWS